jgi:alpha-tubulin suppressor-like RCC1 family protein
MPRYRHRSTSYGSLHDHHGTKNSTATETDDLKTAKTLMNGILALRDSSGRSFLHTPYNLTMAKALLDRAKALDALDDEPSKLWQRRCLLQVNKESRYTPFHSAIMDRNLAAILLFIRHAMDTQNTERLTQSPMTVLHTAESSGSSDGLIQEMATAVDKEGFTPLELLGRIQQNELAQCRKRLMPTPEVSSSGTNRRQRQSSFDDGQHQGHEELSLLADHMDLLETQEEETSLDECSYACEVVTFGRPNHCALGVVSSSNNEGSKHASAFRPQRVQEFAQDSIGRDGSAVAIAAATHHTLVATKNGHLYAFGLGKGGRLGIGDDQVQQCLLPRRVRGPLARHKVVGVAAAENHSLCVTSSGILFAWGSNRFGQLGSAETKSLVSSSSPPPSKGSNSNNFRCLPRRVEDLRNIPCIAVAAGEKHSVALSRRGEVYVWGDNTAGQLGVPRRSGTQKVQRVEALWNTAKTAIAISAAEQSTLVLTSPVPGFAQVNSVYAWGHGNYVPSRVNFEDGSASRNGIDQGSLSSRTRRVINPVGIACAKYHNTAITSDGHVYTWGLHAESLGRIKRQQHPNSSSPQLVTGMLPENGGGAAVALSASDQHTAVVTECGALFTWGTTYGNNVLGHEGVRYQPSPKRVAGVHRAVNVAVAKEHTVLLIGSSFPRIPIQPGLSSLEFLASRKIAEYVDLFNVIPILIMAERTEVCIAVWTLDRVPSCTQPCVCAVLFFD